MFMGEVDIGFRTPPPPPIIKAMFLDYWVFIFMITREVDIGLRPANFLHITIVGYTLSTQSTPNNI